MVAENVVDRLLIDAERMRVRRGTKWVKLTKAEFAVYTALARNVGRVLTRDQLLTAIGGASYVVSDRTVDNHCMKLRKKLGKRTIETVRDVGYAIRVND